MHSNMKAYDVYIGYGDKPDAQEAFTHLEGFALGLGMPGFTSFDARGGWLSPVGDEIYEPVRVFRFILPDTLDPLPWSIEVFISVARQRLNQGAVLVTATKLEYMKFHIGEEAKC